MYQKICDFINKELTELDHRIVSNGKLSMNELQYVDLLSHAEKSLLTSEAMKNHDKSEEESYKDGYSRGYNDGYSRSEGGYQSGSDYGARGRGRGARRDSMGRYADGYSADGGYNAGYQEYRSGKEMIGELHNLMKMAPNEEVKRKYESFISEMEHMM